MNNEIKEILVNIKTKYNDYYVQDIVSGKDLKILLDYINHLERIKEEQYKAIKDCKAYISECVRLQAIIDKAIEYIDNHNKLEQELGGTIRFNLVKLYTILKGGDK